MSDEPGHMVDWSFQPASEMREHLQKYPTPDYEALRAEYTRLETDPETMEKFESWKQSDAKRRAAEDACIPRLISGECKVRLSAHSPWAMADMIGRWMDPDHCIEGVILHVWEGEQRVDLICENGMTNTVYGLYVDVLDRECVLIPKDGEGE